MEKFFGCKNLGDGPKKEFLNLLKRLVVGTNLGTLKVNKIFLVGSEE